MRAFLDRVAAGVNRILDRLPPPLRTIARQFTQVGIVGLIGLVIDVGLFNLLRWLEPEWGPIWPKVISTGLAIIANWIGNRYWTFRDERRREVVSEGIEFVVVSSIGALIPLGCLWVSHYLLGHTSQFADNISANVIGLVLGTLFRFTFYRLWVFRPGRGTPVSRGRSEAGEPVCEPVTAAAAPPSSAGGTPDPHAAPRRDP